MKPHKFRRKFSFVVGFFVLLIGVVLGGYFVLQSKSGQANLLGQVAQNIKDQDLNNDNDSDGLKNWEETIYNTDPENPDTDNDEYLDGEEVAAGFDPTKPAPNDKLPSNTSKQIRPEPGNLTQVLGYILGTQLKSGQMPPLITTDDGALEQSIEQAIDQKVLEAVQKASANFLSEFRPDFEKITIASDDGIEAIRAYAKEADEKIGPTESCQDRNNPKDDADIIQEAIETKNFEQTNCLIDSYLEGYEILINIPVPQSWINIHKDMLTFFWQYHIIYKHLPSYEKDPLKGMLILEKLEENSKLLIDTLEKMQNDLNNRL